MDYDIAMLFSVVPSKGFERGYLIPTALVSGEYLHDEQFNASVFTSLGNDYYFPDYCIEDCDSVVGFPISFNNLSCYIQSSISDDVSYNCQDEEFDIEPCIDDNLLGIYRNSIEKYMYVYQQDEMGRIHVYQIDSLEIRMTEVDMRKHLYDQETLPSKVLYYGKLNELF